MRRIQHQVLVAALLGIVLLMIVAEKFGPTGGKEDSNEEGEEGTAAAGTPTTTIMSTTAVPVPNGNMGWAGGDVGGVLLGDEDATPTPPTTSAPPTIATAKEERDDPHDHEAAAEKEQLVVAKDPVSAAKVLQEKLVIKEVLNGFYPKQKPSAQEATEREWFVVAGIPSVDNAEGKERRSLQRSSWHRFSNVYHSERNPSGRFLVRYLIGKHPDNDYRFSLPLYAEAEDKNDIIALELREGKPTTGKKVGEAGHWGLESEVGMSRKAYAWYCLAALKYPKASYVLKADDDYFLRTRLYEIVLTSLGTSLGESPPESGKTGGSVTAAKKLYWGSVMKWGAKKGDVHSVFRFVGGMSVTMSMDLVQWVASNPSIRRYGAPYPTHTKGGGFSMEVLGDGEGGGGGTEDGDKKKMVKMFKTEKDVKNWYKEVNMDHEDVMVGRWFYDHRVAHTILKDCRFHDVHAGANIKPLTDNSIGVHHIKSKSEFESLLQRFATDGVLLGGDGDVEHGNNNRSSAVDPSHWSGKGVVIPQSGTMPPTLPPPNIRGVTFYRLC